MDRTERDMNPHTLHQLSEDLDTMHGLVLKMGGLVENRLSEVVKALGICDVEAAKAIANSDYKVNTLEVQVDAECTKILALHSIVAGDLRMVMIALKMVTDLERIGDEAKKIAKQVSVVDKGGFPERLLSEVREYGDKVIKTVRLSLDSFARLEDENHIIRKYDHEIDNQCQELLGQILAQIVENPNNVSIFLSLIWCIRSLERIGDHAKNISEYTVYLVEGTDVRHLSKKKSVTA